VSARRAVGALVVLVAVQASVLGLYLPPVFQSSAPVPPQIIISFPVQTATCNSRESGALTVLVAVQPSVFGLYLPPVFLVWNIPSKSKPPQTIISLPVHTAV